MTEATAKPLGKITAVLADLGLEVTYAYDDLVFIQDCAFLMQFTEHPNAMDIYCNIECTAAVADAVVENIVINAKKEGFIVIPKGTYKLSANEDDTLNIEFT